MYGNTCEYMKFIYIHLYIHICYVRVCVSSDYYIPQREVVCKDGRNSCSLSYNSLFPKT